MLRETKGRFLPIFLLLTSVVAIKGLTQSGTPAPAATPPLEVRPGEPAAPDALSQDALKSDARLARIFTLDVRGAEIGTILEAVFWGVLDAEARKLGERTGLDTPVVPALNDGY